jgi:proteasome accessory factor A
VLDVQREYLAKASDFTGNRGADAVSRRVLRIWERALDAIDAQNLDAIAREIDWVIIHRGRGLYYQLQRSNEVDRAARDIDIFEAKTVPPAPGRYRQAG